MEHLSTPPVIVYFNKIYILLKYNKYNKYKVRLYLLSLWLLGAPLGDRTQLHNALHYETLNII